MRRSCSFPTRWCEIRADGRPGKRLDGTAAGSFSYVIMQKGVRQPTQSSAPRLLDIQRSHHHSTCTVCTSFNGLQQFVISKRAGPLYKKLKSKKSGELLPISVSSFISLSFGRHRSLNGDGSVGMSDPDSIWILH
ncbi:unnamed protein product [Anisakis simplex]|uniref:Uncharacterized protein n=1 Tax=Anisakis simplex TaxID=6269 RepID=A0A3P6NM58_ANISI|nr:unnamed protein product [Anisakis simplex]